MSRTLRRLAAGSALALVLATPAAMATATADGPADGPAGGPADRGPHRCSAGPDRIDLPQGWQPEGITTGGRRLYVGSLADGRILRADPRTARVRVLPRSGTGTAAVGIDHDSRRRVLWVAGGAEGEVRVHSKRSGRLLRTYTMPTDPDGRFVNDLVVTRHGAYATDSRNAELAVVPLGGRGLPPSGAADTRPVTGDFELVDGFNLNGIVRSGRWLLAVQSATGDLFRIDPASGDSTRVDLGDYALANGDGLELDGDLLFVVRNRDNLVAAVRLAEDRASGRVVAEITDEDLDVPTTAAHLGKGLYAVNARFGTPDPASADYWITRLTAVR
ncbi:SMP-30/gluconolactonase/LRE family protein [Nocardioides donggukensis]|uniref:Superoxide dismutase n=1 Tax=Nocardioides donggukensis TaxID=2774019 RepID=A0A927K3D5_9ACTN|nr:superoxide dismutase [Nocardioides donggukensis]MBD8869374.1 superoxide dismutase [Nocardioides donggukensis]